MAKRQLTQDEKDANNYAIKNLLKEIDMAKYISGLGKLDLELGLPLKFEKAKRETERQVKENLELLELNLNKIKELREQNENGVDVKNG
jgi:hypothetical protein